MKAIILIAIRELIIKKFGRETWERIASEAGLDPEKIILAWEVVDDNIVFNIIKASAKLLNTTINQVLDLFADYWISEFAPKYYKIYYLKARSARDFLLMMDEVHQIEAKKGISDPTKMKPPRFEYETPDDRTIIIHYISHRNLIDLAVSLSKAVCKYYNEPCTVTKLNNRAIKVAFMK